MDNQLKEIPETVKAFTAGLLERSLWSFHTNHRQRIPRATICFTPQSQDTNDLMSYYWKFYHGSKKMIVIRGSLVYFLASQCLPYLITKKRHAFIFIAAHKIVTSGAKRSYSMKKGEKKYLDGTLANLSFLNDLLIKVNSEHPGYKNRAKVFSKTPRFYDKQNFRSNNNIFDFFDGALSSEDTTMAKSIFDDLLPK